MGTANAQKRKKTAKKIVPQLTPEEKLFEELLPSTAKIMFVDSVVVDKEQFLSTLPLTDDTGTITHNNGVTTYTNGFANTRVYAEGDTISGRHLYMTHYYGKEWDKPTKLNELSANNPDYPFLMADGVTLYFSAEGEGTLGGRDIFLTTYNADDAQFYDPVNMGLPYNSSANDYMLAISDIDNIGWLVTDRQQPEGKVCIYTFEPTQQRKTFDEDTTKETLVKFARIESIQDTWKFGNQKEAMARGKERIGRQQNNNEKHQLSFIVNDKKIYTTLEDFHSKNGREKYLKILANKEKINKLQTLLDSSRQTYTNASRSKKHDIGRQIIALEQEINTLATETAEDEKTLRNAENKR